MTTFTIGTNARITHLDKPDLDVWIFRDPDAVESTVGVEGELSVRPELRRSKSVRDKFKFEYRSDFLFYFSKIEIGIGNKHIYSPGDFMKKHYDSRLPPRNGLEHIMTMVVVDYYDDALLVDGKRPNPPSNIQEYSYNRQHKCVFFTLNMPHEVVPSITPRISFTFPIFGIYDFIGVMKKSCIRKRTISVHEHVFTQVCKYIETTRTKDGEEIDFMRLFGLIKALQNTDLNCRMKTIIRDHYGHWYDNVELFDDAEKDKVYFQYRLNPNDAWKETDSLVFRNPDYIEVKSVSPIMNGLLNIRDVIRREIDAKTVEKTEEEPEVSKNVENGKVSKGVPHESDFSAQTEQKNPQKILNFDPNPFIAICEKRYFTDSTINDLSVSDRAVYDELLNAKRTVAFVPVAHIFECFPVYRIENGYIGKTETLHSKFNFVSSIDVEFDDNGSYNPSYELVHGIFLVQ